MADEAHETPNSVPAHREPPPSLGRVAHIWAGHFGTVDADEHDAEPAEVARDAGAIELRSQRMPRVKVD
jgi:hypothetical protein